MTQNEKSSYHVTYPVILPLAILLFLAPPLLNCPSHLFLKCHIEGVHEANLILLMYLCQKTSDFKMC